ncbi:MAG: endonuclease/exonuclease/phosphatase family protein [Bifidobacteriaceae bacterium]|jgi:exodeoxyribonuclease-3|nr:endonuclease/exonuclease/phosphatase family protein [Bifidobacteriaceae bacterium]
MRIATWNINSVRARVDRVAAYLQARQIDVLALQETKVKDAAFPAEPFEAAGYQVARHGLNQWNGVALISRVGLAGVRTEFPGQPAFAKPGAEPALEARAIGADCGGVTVWSLYVPHGRAQLDPHMAYKLQFLRALAHDAAGWLAAEASAQFALVGDFNVAPLDTDVWDPALFEGKTHTSGPERAALAALAEAGLREVTREHIPAGQAYTFWDYQQLRFPKNEGMRIDFAYCSPALADRVGAVRIAREERKGKGAPDHVPVELDLAPNPPARPKP